MSNIGTSVAKMTMLVGGAVLGAFLARLCDELMVAHSRTQADYDKTRYAQGLSAVALPPVAPPQAPFQAPNVEEQRQYNEYE